MQASQVPVPFRRGMLAFALALVAATAGVAAQAAPTQPGALHVPSPDWRDQVIYFLMIDRFDDAQLGNNDQGVDEYDPTDPSHYSGGDIQGITRRLDYIKSLGATAVWITPPVANQWWNPRGSYSGYHGYWASDFGAVDAHYGTLADYQALSRALHGRGMYLVQDVVVNHVADYLDCKPGDDGALDPGRDCSVRADARGRTAPVQSPFDRNDARNPEQRAEAIYHWTPEIIDFTERRQELDFALAGLDDLDTENPNVRDALRASYGHWIREVGVDAFRVDTAFHVPADFFPDFLHSDDAAAPGMTRVAAATGHDDFLSFGEGFGSDKPFDDTQARKLDSYMRVPGGLPSMINFPLYGSLGDVFARGRPTAELRHRIESMLALHADPHRMPSFIDNHDVDRFLAGSDGAGLRQALLAMLTLPGIPVIYYGTEQGFSERRASMFARGVGSGGRDHFDIGAPLYRYLQDAIALRRDHKLFSRGTPTVLAADPAGAGAIAWRTDHDGNAALVVLNSADHPALLDHLDTGLPAGTRLQGLFGIDDAPADLVAGADGEVTLVLPSRSGQVWQVERGGVASESESTSAVPPGSSSTSTTATASSVLTIAPLQTQESGDPPTLTGNLELAGTVHPGQTFQLVVDGNLAAATAVRADADGRWHATVRTDGMTDPAIEHRVVAFDPTSAHTSPARPFRVALDWRLRVDQPDPHGDDTGPTGNYSYPLDPGWRDLHPADIERVRVWTAGGALRFELTLPGISTGWNPANGFDRVAFTAYLQLPGVDGGATAMPQQHADLPDGMHWHRRLRAHGWSNALFGFDGAGTTDEGTPVTPGAAIDVDAVARTITFTLPATALGTPDSLAGAKLHVTTWDYDSGYRPLAPEAGPVTFGGGETGDPRVMDAATVDLQY
ncbi:alpha-amylase family glycosyl hydrolase [Lysobacter sp. F6437]|uniref:alpha-amylase family glycosyl hydrolase n=1 Tax=Lysobacter sp. F6437 TaxID=3459296 RepID=UPI00403D5FCE